MATTELGQRLHAMDMEAQLVTMAVTVVLDRIGRLSKEDRNDLFALVKELASATTDEDRIGIRDTMVEIPDGRAASVERADLSESGNQPEQWQRWTEWVSKRIRDARNEAALTQEQLAAASGLPQSHISRIENAKHSPARATIEKIAKALGKPVEYFDCH
ncbi:MAG: helix-turn-helix transcriptional regulator [Planctomycetota bacterium]|nr:helix-turn-helix transcriptional regulator [Planctomycetota bacterium]